MLKKLIAMIIMLFIIVSSSISVISDNVMKSDVTFNDISYSSRRISNEFNEDNKIINYTIWPQTSELNQPGNKRNDNTKIFFTDTITSHLYTIYVSSQNDIVLHNYSVKFEYYLNENVFEEYNYFSGFIITDGSEKYGRIFNAKVCSIDSLEYFHFKFGPLCHTYDNRTKRNMSGDTAYYRAWSPPGDVILNSGNWNIVNFGSFMHIPEDIMITNITVWMNISGSDDISITTSNEGKMFKFWYGEFDANLIVNKNDKYSIMINGEASFDINNSLIYMIIGKPAVHGFWNLKWTTPDGAKSFRMKINRNNRLVNQRKFNDCRLGVGGSGLYKIRTSYFDYIPLINNDDISSPFPTAISVIGLDVPLK